MNKNIETQKIKVNNGQELIAEAKKWKNSGGEWKLRERYMEMPKGEGSKKRLDWGIIISNGKKEVNICSLREEGFSKKSGVYDEVEVRSQLHELFPRAAEGLFASNEKDGPWEDKIGRHIQSKLDHDTYKPVKEVDGECHLYRYLVAENNWDLKLISHQYVRENETKIYQSTNPHFSGWVEIIDGQDGNMYLYVGEKNDNGGREIKIGITKSEFENCKRDYSGDTPLKSLEDFWGLFTIDRPRTPAETHEYYSKNGGLEEEWQRNWPHRQGLCRKYLEELRERLTKKFNYWQEKAKQKNHWDHEANEQTLLANHHVAEIDAHLDDMKKNRPAYYVACDKNCDICGVKLCCHFEGRACLSDKKWTRPDENFLHYHGRTPEPEENKNNQMSESEKQQILQYFLKNGIKKISLKEGQLIITHNNNNNTTITNEDPEQQNYHKIIEKLPTQSLSLSELQNNNTNSNSNKDDESLYKGLAIGAVVVVLITGLIAYCWKRKNRSTFCRNPKR
ncbi:MAG: hypothetical protein MRERV_5c082 [Mycoplasmataceae bacterium RV_VA103A]|nr:MAG: hypothetical protein MRERV_5c082 [Mycoplasmataceae bacterium RV_VA103A]